MRDAMDLLINRIAKVIWNLCAFAIKWKAEPTLAYTHLQPAQLITVGKRASQWIQDLMLDLESIEQVRRDLKFRGAQGKHFILLLFRMSPAALPVQKHPAGPELPISGGQG